MTHLTYMIHLIEKLKV